MKWILKNALKREILFPAKCVNTLKNKKVPSLPGGCKFYSIHDKVFVRQSKKTESSLQNINIVKLSESSGLIKSLNCSCLARLRVSLLRFCSDSVQKLIKYKTVKKLDKKIRMKILHYK